MKITILANRDLASNFALNYLVSGLAAHQLNIFLSDQVGSSNTKNQRPGIPKSLPETLAHLKFFEQHLFNQIVFPTVPQDSHSNSQMLTFKGLAAVIGRPIQSLNHINQEDGLKLLASNEPDLILSVRFGKILQPPAIKIPKIGVINLHSGLLPKYQGVMATFWAMLNQDSEYGSTLHFIDSAAIDSGPILNIQKQPLDLSKSYFENVLALYPEGCKAIIDAVNQLAQGELLSPSPQKGKAHYYSFPGEDEIKQFERLKLRLIDTEHIMRLVKAYQGVES